MTKRSDPQHIRPSPNELPQCVQTDGGPAIVSLLAVAFGVTLAEREGSDGSIKRVDRLFLALTAPGQAEVYAVFERAAAPEDPWRQLTGHLTAAELDDWSAHRYASPQPVADCFAAWFQDTG